MSNDDRNDFKQKYYETGNNDAVEDALGEIEKLPTVVASTEFLISRYDAKDKAKEIIYSILDDTDYNDIESMAHACLMMKIKILKMFDEFPSADMVSRENFEPVDNKLYLNPVCRNCKHSNYCNNIPTDKNNEDIEHYDAYGRPILSIRECKDYEPESE